MPHDWLGTEPGSSVFPPACNRTAVEKPSQSVISCCPQPKCFPQGHLWGHHNHSHSTRGQHNLSQGSARVTCSSCTQGQQEPSDTLAAQLSPALCPGAMPVLLCLGWVFSSPALLLGLPAGAHLGQRACRDRAVSALLLSACPESPLPRLRDSSWGRQ